MTRIQPTTMMRMRPPYSYFYSRPHGRHEEDEQAILQDRAGVFASGARPDLVDAGQRPGRPGPVPGRAMDHAPNPAVLSRPCPPAADRESDDLAWRRGNLGQR